MENDDPVMEAYAQKAYETYSGYWKASFNCETDPPSWDELHELEKASWVEVAKAIHGEHS